jgi:toxin ParE1/3/4
MPGYQLTPNTRADLRNIARYTKNTWGLEQTAVYRKKLTNCFDKIGRHEFPARCFHLKFPDVLIIRCEHHLVFYLETPLGEQVPIIAVLHKNMDLIKRIKSRNRS